MNRIFLPLALVLALFATSLQAQGSKSTTRVELQHKPPHFMEKHLREYEVNLVKSLQNENTTIQAQAVQTMRDLEQMFPAYPFKGFLEPLEAKLKDENADGIVRNLAALALDELHSDAGDAIIKSVAESTKDSSLHTLCDALLIRSTYN